MRKYFELYILLGIFLFSILSYFLNIEVDFSRNKINSISKASKKIIRDLDSNDVEILYFSAISDDESSYVLGKVKSVFRQLKKYNNKIKCKIIDLDESPNERLNYKEATFKSILIRVGDKHANIEFDSYSKKQNEYLELDIEGEIIATLDKLTKKENIIYYTYGHGEIFEDEKLTNFRILLINSGYNFEKISINDYEKIKDNFLFIISPSKDFNQEEIDSLYKYIWNEGKVFITFDVYEEDKQTNLLEFCNYAGFKIGKDILVDPILDTKLMGRFSEHEIINNISSNLTFITFPNARELNFDENSIMNFKSVIISDETVKNGGSNFFAIPLVIAGSSGNSKLLISGGVDFLNNSNIKDNKTFIIHMMKWLDPNVDLGINKIKDESLFIKSSKNIYYITFFIVVIVIPICGYIFIRILKKRI